MYLYESASISSFFVEFDDFSNYCSNIFSAIKIMWTDCRFATIVMGLGRYPKLMYSRIQKSHIFCTFLYPNQTLATQSSRRITTYLHQDEQIAIVTTIQ